MKQKKWILTVLMAVLLIFGAGFAVGATTMEPGSTGDPIVTKSYVDNALEQVELQTGYQEVSLSKGKQLVCSAGTQLIVISGAAKTTAQLSDTTEGEKLAKGKTIELDHSYLVLKKGAAIKATKSAKVFVCGAYSIK